LDQYARGIKSPASQFFKKSQLDFSALKKQRYADDILEKDNCNKIAGELDRIQYEQQRIISMLAE